MEFYHLLAKYYDEIFPVKNQQLEFLRDYLTTNSLSSVLDVGCGTGSYMLEMNKLAFETTGVDLSQDMVNIAQTRAQQAGSRAKFAVSDMMDLTNIQGKFGLVLCIGNTLAHVAGENELQQVLKQFSQKADHLIVQVVNYDRVLAKKITELPEIRSENLSFKRHYQHLANGFIEFSTSIELFNQGTLSSSATQLYPVTEDRLKYALEAAGWKATVWYGDFAKTAWTREAPATIVTARRQPNT